MQAQRSGLIRPCMHDQGFSKSLHVLLLHVGCNENNERQVKSCKQLVNHDYVSLNPKTIANVPVTSKQCWVDTVPDTSRVGDPAPAK